MTSKKTYTLKLRNCLRSSEVDFATGIDGKRAVIMWSALGGGRGGFANAILNVAGVIELWFVEE